MVADPASPEGILDLRPEGKPVGHQSAVAAMARKLKQSATGRTAKIAVDGVLARVIVQEEKGTASDPSASGMVKV